MKKLIMFLSGLALLVLTFGLLYLTGAIYDAGEKRTVDTYFFQPNNLSSQRPGEIQTPDEMGDSRILTMLVDRYVTEYFYAIPDRENIARRTRTGDTLARMSSDAVFNAWRNTTALDIQHLADEKALRTAAVIGDIVRPSGSDYWQVDYELRTWRTPNDLTVAPDVTRGTMFMKIRYESGLRNSILEYGIHKFLDNGGDPATLFKFQVTAIEGVN